MFFSPKKWILRIFIIMISQLTHVTFSIFRFSSEETLEFLRYLDNCNQMMQLIIRFLFAIEIIISSCNYFLLILKIYDLIASIIIVISVLLLDFAFFICL